MENEFDRFEQLVKAGLPFNPISESKIFGENRNRLLERMKSLGWDDPRFVTQNQAEKNGWSIRPGAESVETFLRDKKNGQVKKVELFNASNVIGMPSIQKMLESIKSKIETLRGASPIENRDQWRNVEFAPADEKFDFNEPSNLAAPRTLLDGDLVRGDDGIYHPADSEIEVLADRADSVTVLDKHPDAYKAAIELAQAKGWQTIVISGDPAQLPDAWVAARLANVGVANYAPTQLDLKRLANARAERDERDERDERQNVDVAPDSRTWEEIDAATMAEMGREWEDGDQIEFDHESCEHWQEVRDLERRLNSEVPTVPTVTRGEFSGSVVKVAGGVATQRINREGKTVEHDLRALSGPVVEGQIVDIKYVDGVGQVGGQGVEKGVGR